LTLTITRGIFERPDTQLEPVEAGPEHHGDTGNKTHHRHDRADTPASSSAPLAITAPIPAKAFSATARSNGTHILVA
jgi:hypothetical protein